MFLNRNVRCDLRIYAMIWAVSVCFAISFLGAFSADGQELKAQANSGEKFDIVSVAERRAICGNNCTYAFLKMHGASATYSEVEEFLGVSIEGTSLLSLRDAAHHFGMSARVIKCDTKQLASQNLPAIAFGKFGSVTDSTQFDDDRMGHFVVVLQVDGDTVKCLDGTTCSTRDIGMEYFDRKSSIGVFLVPETTTSSGWEFYFAVGSTVVMLMVVWIAWPTATANQEKNEVGDVKALDSSVPLIGSALVRD